MNGINLCFDALTAVVVKIIPFWDMKLPSLLSCSPGVIFNFEEGGSTFLLSVDTSLPDYTVYHRTI
jgi:hypothetical protein